MRGALKQVAAVVAAVVLLPSLAFAQGTLTGTVRDPSGGVLPGVTVEASSPALIERVRTVVTDGTGQYRIIELNPGTYVLTFTMPGFNTVRREGIELSGSATLTIPIEMRLGDLQETITVSGESPVVDVQTVRRETVLSGDIVNALPSTRAYGALLNITPGITVDGNGLAATPTMTFFSARGGQTNEGRVTINGMTVAAAFNGGGVSSLTYDSVNVDEVSVVVSGGLGETDIGGPVMNLAPRAGGNTFRGSAFVNHAGDWSRGNNLDDRLRAVGITETPGIIHAYDTSLSYGGPIRRDRLWFYGSVRKLDTTTAVEGIVANANAGDLSRWDWAPDDSITARQMQGREMFIGRLTGQASAKHRLSVSHEYQTRCEGSPLRQDTPGCHSRGSNWIALGSAGASPESNTGYFDFPYNVTQATWTAPMTNRLLLEAGFTRFAYRHAGGPGQLPPDGIFDIAVTEQSALFAPRSNYTYRALAQYLDNYGNPNNWRASASYVTGSHNVKVGYQGSYLIADTRTVVNPTGLSYTFNQGNPINFTFRIPEWRTADRTQTTSLFVQDSWTRGRLTLQGALRYDRVSSFSPAQGNGTAMTSRFNPEPITFERTAGVNAYNDVTPRIGVAYDVFGNGRTAVKFNLGHYLDAATNDSIYTMNNPAGGTKIVRTVTRSWQDTNGDKVVDCDIMNFAAHTEGGDTCGALGGNNLNFGNVSNNVAQVNPALLKGWGVRENDWQWGINLQQEVMPRVSVEVGYNRRWWNGQTVTNNLMRDPSQYDAWTIMAPVDERLPNGGGYPITLYTVTAAANAIPAQNYVTLEKDFGKRIEYWHGVDVTANARLRNGLALQAGTSTGRKVLNTCDIAGRINSPDTRGCNNVDPFQTTLRGLASYTVPKVDVLVSGTMRSQPPLRRAATWNVPNTVVRDLLGRLPPGGLAGGTTNVALLDNEERLYADNRRTQIDMRIAKLLRFGGTRSDIGLDLGNLLNTNYATSYENTYQYSEDNALMGGSWNNPTAVYTPRFVRVNYSVSF